MAYECRIEADSVNSAGDRLTTFVITYPRFVHSELMTHRVFSRNSSSSRAIPSAKLIQQVIDDPAGPVWWGKNQSGMQAREELSGQALEEAKRLWLIARDQAVASAENLMFHNLHKQIANRILEPWMWITVIVSATEYQNWFKQRDHKDAQPEIREIAAMMREQYGKSNPELLYEGAWHLPFVRTEEQKTYTIDDALKLSTARCARVSYLTHDGKHDPQADFDLHDRLASTHNSDDPGHYSPFEHPAQARPWAMPNSNFTGWQQYRKQFPGESGRGA